MTNSAAPKATAVREERNDADHAHDEASPARRAGLARRP